MKTLLKKFSSEQYGKVVYAGAGNGEFVESLLNIVDDELLLIEPNVTCIPALESLLCNTKGKVHPLALGESDSKATFSEYIPSKFSALSGEVILPKALKRARLKAKYQVNVRSLDSLFRSNKWETTPSSISNNLLILTINGCELDALNGASIETLNFFDVVIVEIDTSGVFVQDNRRINEVKAVLFSSNFYFEDSESGLFSSTFLFKKDKHKIKLKKLLNEKNNEINSLKEKHADIESHYKNEMAIRDKLKSKINNLECESRKTEIEFISVTQERDKLIAEIEGLKEDFFKKKHGLDASVSKLNSELAGAKEIIAELTKKNEVVKSVESELLSNIANINSANSIKENEMREVESRLNKRIEVLENENEEFKKTSTLSQKIIAKYQIDLSDLQGKYAHKVEAESDLVDLIQELKEKLTIASKYYLQLKEEYPELLELDIKRN